MKIFNCAGREVIVLSFVPVVPFFACWTRRVFIYMLGYLFWFDHSILCHYTDE